MYENCYIIAIGYYNAYIFFILFQQLSFIGHDCKDIPNFLGETYGHFARRLDLSFNQLR